MTPAGTCIEGEWDEVMSLVKECHQKLRETSPHVITTVRIEDDEGAEEKLTRNVESVEEKLNRDLDS